MAYVFYYIFNPHLLSIPILSVKSILYLSWPFFFPFLFYYTMTASTTTTTYLKVFISLVFPEQLSWL